MEKRLAIMGAGAVGGYVGGHMARAGADVTLIDPWPEHVDQIKNQGLYLKSPEREERVRVKAMHLHEVQSLFRDPIDIAFIATKSYDTEWATRMIRPYLAPQGFVVSLQNGINEESIAGIVGWGRTVGCVVSAIGVEAYEPGRIMRTVAAGETPTRFSGLERCTVALPKGSPRLPGCWRPWTAPR